MYQLINLADLALIGGPAPLPPEMVGLTDAVLSDFTAAMDPPPVGYEGKGLWPVTFSAPVDLNAATEIATDDVASRAPDPDSKTITAVYGKRTLTPEELAARNPVPVSVGPAQAKTALYNSGKLEAAQAAIDAANYPPMTIYWESATIWLRSHPYLQGLAVELGLDDDQVDDLFRAAAALE